MKIENDEITILFAFLGEMQCIAFRLMLSSCVCVSVCVYAAFVDAKKKVCDRDVVFLICTE